MSITAPGQRGHCRSVRVLPSQSQLWRVQGNVCVVNGSPQLCSVLLYERSRKQWIRHAPMNAPRLHAAMASVGGRVYITVSPLPQALSPQPASHKMMAVCTHSTVLRWHSMAEGSARAERGSVRRHGQATLQLACSKLV